MNLVTVAKRLSALAKSAIGQVHVPVPLGSDRVRKDSDFTTDTEPPLNNLDVQMAHAALETEMPAEYAGFDLMTEPSDPYADVLKAGPRRVATVAIRCGDHLLMGKRRDNDLWTVPGGHVDPGENFHQGGLREVLEESGIELDPEEMTELTPVNQFTDGEGLPLEVQPFIAYMDERPSTSMLEDPDGEVYRWQWINIDTGLPDDIAAALHVPLERNCLMQALGLAGEIDDPGEAFGIDLGSGNAREPGYLGVDTFPFDEETMVHDLNMALPFDDNSVDSVRLVNVLHEMELQDPAALLTEIHRVLTPGGQLHYEGPNELSTPDGLDEVDRVEGITKEGSEPSWYQQTFVCAAEPDPATADDTYLEPGLADDLPLLYTETVAKGGPGSGPPHPSKDTSKIVNPDDQGRGQHPNHAENAMHSELTNSGFTYQNSQAVAHGQDERHISHNYENNIGHQISVRAKEGKDTNGWRFTAGQKGSSAQTGKGGQKALSSYLAGRSAVKKNGRGQFTAYVPIAKISSKRQIVYCVVLSPEESDEQEDYMTAEDIELACHRYMLNSRVVGVNHTKAINAKPVECYIMPMDMEWDGGQYGPQKVKKGSWVVGLKIFDKSEWAKVENGDYEGVSVSGVGLRDDMVAG